MTPTEALARALRISGAFQDGPNGLRLVVESSGIDRYGQWLVACLTDLGYELRPIDQAAESTNREAASVEEPSVRGTLDANPSAAADPEGEANPKADFEADLREALITAFRSVTVERQTEYLGLEARLIADSSDPRSRCANCARRIVVEFVAPSDLWKAAAREYAHDHLCLTCFDERVPDDWPIQWESVVTLWPISKKRAMEEVGRGIPR